jgi:rhamnose utilization protein RhaD (predicted bifunctional aldolase and dehydrogenase)
MNYFDDLSFIGKYLGSSIEWVQAGGGNISIKDNEHLLIKSSGCTLSEIEENYGISIVDLKKAKDLNQKLENINESNFGKKIESLLIDSNQKRPSIETPLHSLIDYKVVLHIHPISVISIVSQTNSKELLSKSFSNYSFIPYATPGKKLAQAFKENYNGTDKVIFMENHGLVIAHETVEGAINLLEDTISKVNLLTSYSHNSKPQNYISFFKKKLGLNLSVYESIDERIVSTYRANKYTPICPDDVVYISHEVLEISSESSFDDYIAKYSTYPRVILDNDSFYFVANNIPKAKHIYEQFFSSITAASLLNKNIYISEKEQNFLLNWEAEKYRQQKA